MVLNDLVEELQSHINNGDQLSPDFFDILATAFTNEADNSKKQIAFAQLNQLITKIPPKPETYIESDNNSGHRDGYFEKTITDTSAVVFNNTQKPKNDRIDTIFAQTNFVPTLIACAVVTPQNQPKNYTQKACSVLASLRNTNPATNKQMITAFAGANARGSMLEAALNTHFGTGLSAAFSTFRNTHSMNEAIKAMKTAPSK